MVQVLMPYAERPTAEAVRFAPRPRWLDGRTVGIVNNGWRCMNIISEELRALLTERLGIADFVERRISAAQTLPRDDVEQMARTCHAVVVGIGN